jgi:glycerol dehydrogenase
LDRVSDDELMQTGERACAEGETIHNEPIPVSPEAVAAALRAADAQGRRLQES